MESKWVMCDKCVHNKNGVCGHGMMFIEKYPDQYHNCYLFSKPMTLMTKMKNVFKRGVYVVKNLIICLVVLGFLIGAFVGYYCWTKSSLEDLSGKEVKPSTVIWTMFVTGNNK